MIARKSVVGAARIDALSDDYIFGTEAEAMGARMTRSKLLRLLLTKGAEVVEAEQARRRAGEPHVGP